MMNEIQYPVQGTRIWPAPPYHYHPGDYGKDPRNGHWMALTPNGMLADLSGHEVTEHGDGTITVSPSIRVTQPHGYELKVWHGFLEKGLWRLA